MKDNFVRIATITPDIHIGDCEYNAEEIIKAADIANGNNCDIAVFPEMCITGYTCGELFTQTKLLSDAEAALSCIIHYSIGKPVLIFVGMPMRLNGKVYNCAVAIQSGWVLGIIPKKYLPNYGEFYDARWFEPAPEKTSQISFLGHTVNFGTKQLFVASRHPDMIVGAEICEDLWVPNSPSVQHVNAGATIICNLSASNEVIGKSDYRRKLVEMQSGKLCCAYAYASAGTGESTTDLIFSGHNIIAENGSILAESEKFANGITYADIDIDRITFERRKTTSFPASDNTGYLETEFGTHVSSDVEIKRTVSPTPFVPSEKSEREDRCEEIITMQAIGLKRRIEMCRSNTVVLGLSGGLDSTLALLVCIRAFDMMNRDHSGIVAVTMPCFGTTSRTYSNALELAKASGVKLYDINIEKAVNQHFSDIGHDASNHDTTYENAQARERTQVLMDMANQNGGFVVGTGDLSELALGWCTYNADHMSMYNVNVSIPKTLVKYIIHYEANKTKDTKLRDVLFDILDTPISPELLPKSDNDKIIQKTENILGPYVLHDFFLYYTIRWGFTPRKIFELASIAFNNQFNSREILGAMKIFYNRFFAQQFKRNCLPDGPKVGTVSLSPRGDWKMPSDAWVTSWNSEISVLEDKYIR